MLRGMTLLFWALLVVGLASGRLLNAGDEPVATLRFAGIDRFLEDVDYVSTISERPFISRFLRNLLVVGNELNGLDRRRPISAEVFLRPQASSPEFRLCLPLTRMEDFRATTRRLQWKWTSIDEANDEVQRPGSDRLIHVRQQGLWVLLSESPALVQLAVSEELTANDVRIADAVLQLRPDRISVDQRQQFLAQLQRSLDRERRPRSNQDEGLNQDEAGAAMKADLLHLVEQVAALIVDETEAFEIRIEIGANPADSSSAGIVLEQVWRVKPESELVLQLPLLAIETPQFSIDAHRGSAFRSQVALQLPKPVRKVLAQAVELGRTAAQRELAPLKPEIRQTLLGMFETMESTFGRGPLEGFVEFLPTQSGRMVLLSGWRLEQGDKLAAALPLLLPEIGKSGDVDSVTLNAGHLNDTEFHRLEEAEKRRFEERLYGRPAAVYVGAERNALWVAMGDDQTLETIVVRTSERNDARNVSGQLATFEWHVRPWMPLVAEAPSGQRLMDTLRDVFTEEPHDAITGELRAHEGGISGRVTVDAPFLAVLGKLISGGL